MSLRHVSVLSSVATMWFACSPARLTTPTPTPMPTFDAGTVCFVVDWSGVERPVSIASVVQEASFGGTVATTLFFQTRVCDCGLPGSGAFRDGEATCSANPSTQRWDGACTGCGSVSTWCRRPDTGLPTEGGDTCNCGATTGVGYCDFSVGRAFACACPENCVGQQGFSCDVLPCGDGGVARLVCAPGGSTAQLNTPCVCITALDGGR